MQHSLQKMLHLVFERANSKPGLFTAIDSDADALVTIKTSSWLIIAMSCIALAFRLFAGNIGLGIVDAALVIGLTVAVLRLHSRVAAVLLLALSVVSTFATGHNRFFGGEGGANLFMALLILWASVRLVIATFQTHSYRTSPTASEPTMPPAAALNSPRATRTIESDIHGTTTNGNEEGGERLPLGLLMKLAGWSRIMVAITVAWFLALAGLVGYEHQSSNVFCQLDGEGAVCQHIFWLWAYVSPGKYEFTLRYGRLFATALIPVAVLWFCFGAVVWVRAGFKGAS